MLEIIKSQWYFWTSWITFERIHTAGIWFAIAFSIVCFGVIAFMLFYGVAMGKTRDGGIAMGKRNKKKILA